MNYKIIVDSCGELPEELIGSSSFESIPLGLEVGTYHVMDDKNFNQREFLQKVAESPVCPKSYCPSPERYMEACCTVAERVYIITLSSHLSGSYNSAMLGANLYKEMFGEKKIHVIDSRSASGGETQIALKLMELEEQGLGFEEIVREIEAFRDTGIIYFVLDDLEALRKNGRLSSEKALVASTLNIKPVMTGEKGVIVQRGQGIGMRKALGKIADLLLKEIGSGEGRKLIITHCNAPERARLIGDMIAKKAHLAKVLILETGGISSMYASNGGVIVTV